MKLLRHGPTGKERSALLADDGTCLDCLSIIQEITSDYIENVPPLWRADGPPRVLPAVRDVGRSEMPWTGRGELMCISLNYRDHARESGMPEPSEPVLFMKSTTALCGPNDDIRMPRGAAKADWQVELGIVRLDVNGASRQCGSTRHMIFNVPCLVVAP